MGGEVAVPRQPAPILSTPTKTTQQLREEAQLALGIDTVNKYNIAFSGDCNNGKSSLINAFRRVKKDEPSYAETGFMETTMMVTSYAFPTAGHFTALENCILWDIPGANTNSYPTATYIEEKKLYAYDFVILLTGGSLTENDITLAKAINSYNVPFAFVRSKCDQALKDDYEEYGEDGDAVVTEFMKQQFSAEAAMIYRKYMSAHPTLRNAKVYFVSARVLEGKKEYQKYQLNERELLCDIIYKIDIVSYDSRMDKLCQKSSLTFSNRRDISLVRRETERNL